MAASTGAARCLRARFPLETGSLNQVLALTGSRMVTNSSATVG